MWLGLRRCQATAKSMHLSEAPLAEYDRLLTLREDVVALGCVPAPAAQAQLSVFGGTVDVKSQSIDAELVDGFLRVVVRHEFALQSAGVRYPAMTSSSRSSWPPRCAAAFDSRRPRSSPFHRRTERDPPTRSFGQATGRAPAASSVGSFRAVRGRRRNSSRRPSSCTEAASTSGWALRSPIGSRAGRRSSSRRSEGSNGNTAHSSSVPSYCMRSRPARSRSAPSRSHYARRSGGG
jgi:hypothetical protein